MVCEIMEVLAAQPGEIAVDATLGYGGHARELLAAIQPGGKLLGLDVDPLELPKTETRLKALGFPETSIAVHRMNYAGLVRRVVSEDDADATVRRVFQALRIAVNDEFGALDTFLRHLPECLAPGGRVAILTFHSGEDRRVKQSFKAGRRAGVYTAIAE